MASEPQNDMERDFVALVEKARRELFEGPGKTIPLHQRREMLSGMKLTDLAGNPVCTLADDDYLERFRAAMLTDGSTLPNPQDTFAQLIEECRLGQVFRCVLHEDPPSVKWPKGRTWTEYILHRLDVDVDGMPFVFLGETPYAVHHDTLDAVMDTVTGGTFRLLYPRCGFMYRVSSDNPALQIAATLSKLSDVDHRYLLTVVEQDEDGVLCHSFILHDGHQHCMKQIWQARILPSGDIELAHDQQGDVNFEWLLASARNRVEVFMVDCHRLMHRKRGTYTPGEGAAASAKIDKRRSKLKLPTVSRLRIIDLNAPDDVDEPKVSRAGRKGVPKAPHYTQGTWRNYKDGKRVGIKAYATGTLCGSPIPPWYEVRR